MADQEEYVTMTVKVPPGKKKAAKVLALLLDTTLGKLGGDAVAQRIDQEPEFENVITQLGIAARERAGIAAPVAAPQVTSTTTP